MAPSMSQLTTAHFESQFSPANSPADRAEVRRRLIVSTVALAAMVAYFLPFLLLGSKSYITIHDNLDGTFVTNYILVTTGKALTFNGRSPIEQIMNGLPRAALPSGLNISVLLFYIFSPAWAYIVNFMLVHAIAFGGMFLLLRGHFLTEDDDYLLAGAISICFFLVPYYTTYGLSVAGQPLLAYAFLNIRAGRRTWKDYCILLLFPLWSDIALTVAFAETTLALILVIDWARSHKLNKPLLAAMSMHAFAYVVLQYQLINSILGSNAWISHRITWNRWTDWHLSSNLKRTCEVLFTTQYHTGSFWTLPIIVSVGGALVLVTARKRRAVVLEAIALGIALICLEYGFYDWLVRLFGRLLPGLQTFNGSRFYFLLPLLWMLIFALSLKEFTRRKWGVGVAWCLIAIQTCAILKFNTEYADNLRLLTGRFVYEPSFNRFFAADLFSDIDKFIGRPKDSYRVVSIGMHPSIAQFNGFYTLDGYLSNYPLTYKRDFRKIIGSELAKNAELRDYYDGWGNRCYLFSSELGQNYLCSAQNHYIVHKLQLDTMQLRAMGCEYVISAAYIENSEQSGLKLEKQFVAPGSFWHLYLYYVLPPAPARVIQANEREIAGGGKTEETSAPTGLDQRGQRF